MNYPCAVLGYIGPITVFIILNYKKAVDMLHFA